jgi:mannose-6-phosphate isomerase-like protein (cupin superfamily)
MGKEIASRVIRFGDAEGRIPGPPGDHFVDLLQRGTLRVLLSLPVSPNRQTPHTQDEVYVIARGRGVIFHGGARDQFETGDLIFVAAGTEHWFEDFSEDLAVWVVFYGPQGGDVTA